jgi:hypothetical protein
MRRLAFVLVVAASAAACGGGSGGGSAGTTGSGGSAGTGGAAGTGSAGTTGSGGSAGTSGAAGTGIGGGSAGAGGTTGSAGSGGRGGSGGAGGTTGSAGSGGRGGSGGAGGTAGAGGRGGSGGTAGTAGVGGRGGSGGTAGTAGVGGRGGSGGTGGGAPSCLGSKPTAANTGVPAGVALTVVNGDVMVSQNGTTIDAQDIHGFLIIAASNVRVTRSIVRGRAINSNAGVIRINSGTNILIEDVEIAVAAPSATVDGMWGDNFTGRRLNIHGGVDGLKAGSNTTLECSYLHDQMHFDVDPNQGGGPTHNDAIQILEGTGIHIVGNQLVAAMSDNAAIQITQDFGAVGDVHLQSNWADGGGCTFNISHNGAASLTDVHAIGNRFGRNSYFDCPILKSTKTTLDSSGNVWDDDGTTVPIQTHD